MLYIWLLTAIALFAVLFSLWIRRPAWRYRVWRAPTIALGFIAAGILLISPLGAASVGWAIHAVTGRYNMEAFVGHYCFLTAGAAVVYNLVYRCTEHKTQFPWLFHTYVIQPFVLIFPLMLAMILMSSASQTRVDLLSVDSDNWLLGYWVAYCCALCYLMLIACYALLILRADTRNRVPANLYLAACLSGFGFSAWRIIAAFDPWLMGGWPIAIMWTDTCVGCTMIASAAGYSWRVKLRVETERELRRTHE